MLQADAGGSPSLVARGFNTIQAAGSGEQVQIQVPNDKVSFPIPPLAHSVIDLVHPIFFLESRLMYCDFPVIGWCDHRKRWRDN